MSTSPQPAQKGRLPLLRWLRQGRMTVVFSAALVIFLLTQSEWFRARETVQRWEAQAHDVRFRLRGSLPANPNVAIVGICTSSFDQRLLEAHATKSEPLRLMYDNPVWPWPRSIHAYVIERILAAGARVVAVDIVFAADKAEDEALLAVLKKYPGRVVLAATVQRQSAGEQKDKIRGIHYIVQQPNSRLLAAIGTENMGYVTYAGEVDGVHRHFDYRTSDVRENPTLETVADDTRDLWKFAPLAVAKYTGKPLPDDYDQPINFTGPTLNSYPAYPTEELFMDSIWFGDSPRYRKGEAFRDKLVFYGPIAEVLHDVMDTPFGSMPGVEVHAQLAASLIEGRTLHKASPGVARSVAFLCVLASALAVLFIPNALAQVAAVLGIGALFTVGTQFAFTRGGVLAPVVPAIFGLAITGALGVVYQFFLEQWEKAHTRKVLNRFVSKRIAAVVLKNAEEFEHARRGEKRPVAVFFSDIRSFTTWSENAAPENLVGQLNEYFERAVTHIEEREGNVQKFIGDAILAAWGDTHSNGFADDATRAVATALTMRVTLRALNAGWDKREDRIVISIGMGINHGDVVVGEVGHPERREYTVLGDGVNFAARLESATKQFHTDCLVGESVEVLTRDRFVYRHADFVRVKGKNKPVNIFIPLSDTTTPPPEWLADYHKARALYVERKFTEAAALFRAVNSRIGGDDFLCETYAVRCDRYAQEPPPADWDGSYTLTEK
jgi:adenylate cyclase